MASTSQADLTEDGEKSTPGIDNPIFDNPSQENRTNENDKDERDANDSASNKRRYKELFYTLSSLLSRQCIRKSILSLPDFVKP